MRVVYTAYVMIVKPRVIGTASTSRVTASFASPGLQFGKGSGGGLRLKLKVCYISSTCGSTAASASLVKCTPSNPGRPEEANG